MTSVGTQPLTDKSPNGFLTFSLQENQEENGREVGVEGRDERLCKFAGDLLLQLGLIRNNSFDCRERLWWPTPELWFSVLRGILSENLDGNL